MIYIFLYPGNKFFCICIFQGYGGPINSFLAWNAWAPLAKITYACYLVHLTLIAFINSLPQYQIYLSQAYMIYLSLGNIIASMAAGFFCVLLFEAPTMHMEKLLFWSLGITRIPSPKLKSK